MANSDQNYRNFHQIGKRKASQMTTNYFKEIQNPAWFMVNKNEKAQSTTSKSVANTSEETSNKMPFVAPHGFVFVADDTVSIQHAAKLTKTFNDSSQSTSRSSSYYIPLTCRNITVFCVPPLYTPSNSNSKAVVQTTNAVKPSKVLLNNNYLTKTPSESRKTNKISAQKMHKKKSKSKSPDPERPCAVVQPIFSIFKEKRDKRQLKAQFLKKPEKIKVNWFWVGPPSLHKPIGERKKKRNCYQAMRHTDGDLVRVRDCVLLKSDDAPYIAKVAALWENEKEEKYMTLLWYYPPTYTEFDPNHQPLYEPLENELYASRHVDYNHVNCIDSKCYVLTVTQYNRWRKLKKINELKDQNSWLLQHEEMENFVCEKENFTSHIQLPPIDTPNDLVYFCRFFYDSRFKKLVKNPLS